MNSIKRRILEIGHAGAPMKGSLANLARKLPPEVEYHGVEIIKPFSNDTEFERWFAVFYKMFVRPSMPSGIVLFPGFEDLTFSSMKQRFRTQSQNIASTVEKWRTLGKANIFSITWTQSGWLLPIMFLTRSICIGCSRIPLPGILSKGSGTKHTGF